MVAKLNGSNNGENVNNPGKCRYKTGKCNNARSNKRNGQLHQLCLFHREKANRIQRKFDRHKRQLARIKCISKASEPTTYSIAAAFSASLNNTNSSSFNIPLKFSDDFSSDSDSSRFSTDSESSDFSWDELWSDMPNITPCYPDSSVDVVNGSLSEERLSVDEIDFLCSAML